ncbi:methionine ABC transporter ATP-binding protein [Caryophanon latum]|uniref:ABC transporter domain-containing protein n=1 Tax=Caryophanon latum TaxID=33977 RepID=A0A1C0YUC7_9BACL|nr:ATP-binding cassette domain-containing protein [Caryophanon latum]OCS90763.1 hypothetical protein A6K76_01560 [Caryophanon latum]
MITVAHVSKQFASFAALRDVSLYIEKGAIHGIVGASGAGKSTLLRMMNLLERPTSGDVHVNGVCLSAASPKALREARKSIGMIFQHFHLVSNKTVYDNIAVALQLARIPKKEHAARVQEVLQYVGLEAYKEQYPATLSGGQKQRVAIARALVTKPSILLCDEPTSALDPNTTLDILRVLQQIHADFGVTLVIVSHELSVIQQICTSATVLQAGEIYDTLTLVPTGVRSGEQTAESFVRALTGGDAHA